MSDQNIPDTDNGTIKDPTEWTTGEEPMTGGRILTFTLWPARPVKKSGTI